MFSCSLPRLAASLLAVALLILTLVPVDSVLDWHSSTVSAASGTTWHVPEDFSDIQSAIDTVAAGDTILVAPGTYAGSLNFQGKAVFIKSMEGAGVTTILGTGGTTVTIGPQGMLEGFTISDGATYFGAGMLVLGSGTVIRGNIFTNNTQYSGGFGAGIAGNGASPLIERNIFRYNSCDGQYTSGVVSFVNGSSPRIENNIFENNSCRAVNMTIPVGNTPVVANNTIVGNDGGIRIDARIHTATHVYRNNIVVGNRVGFQVDFGSPANNPILENNLVFENVTNYEGITEQTGIQNNISVDPLFMDAESGHYELQVTSPAIDAGNNSACPSTDFSGISRPQGIACDIGAHEVLQAYISVASDSLSVNEGIGIAEITVILDQALPITATVTYSTTASTQPFPATVGQDYLASTGTLTFAPGIIEQLFTVPIIDDREGEHDEKVQLVLSDGIALNVIVHLASPVILTIIDNDYRSYLPLLSSGSTQQADQ